MKILESLERLSVLARTECLDYATPVGAVDTVVHAPPVGTTFVHGNKFIGLFKEFLEKVQTAFSFYN